MHTSLPGDKIYRTVEQMPVFCAEECGPLRGDDERIACSENAQLGFIYLHATYPVEAFDQGLEGTASISFVVGKDGSMYDIRTEIDPGGGLGDAARALVEKMHTEGIKWLPGRQQGEAVRVRVSMPIIYKLAK